MSNDHADFNCQCGDNCSHSDCKSRYSESCVDSASGPLVCKDEGRCNVPEEGTLVLAESFKPNVFGYDFVEKFNQQLLNKVVELWCEEFKQDVKSRQNTLLLKKLRNKLLRPLDYDEISNDDESAELPPSSVLELVLETFEALNTPRVCENDVRYEIPETCINTSSLPFRQTFSTSKKMTFDNETSDDTLSEESELSPRIHDTGFMTSPRKSINHNSCFPKLGLTSRGDSTMSKMRKRSSKTALIRLSNKSSSDFDTIELESSENEDSLTDPDSHTDYRPKSVKHLFTKRSSRFQAPEQDSDDVKPSSQPQVRIISAPVANQTNPPEHAESVLDRVPAPADPEDQVQSHTEDSFSTDLQVQTQTGSELKPDDQGQPQPEIQIQPEQEAQIQSQPEINMQTDSGLQRQLQSEIGMSAELKVHNPCQSDIGIKTEPEFQDIPTEPGVQSQPPAGTEMQTDPEFQSQPKSEVKAPSHHVPSVFTQVHIPSMNSQNQPTTPPPQVPTQPPVDRPSSTPNVPRGTDPVPDIPSSNSQNQPTTSPSQVPAQPSIDAPSSIPNVPRGTDSVTDISQIIAIVFVIAPVIVLAVYIWLKHRRVKEEPVSVPKDFKLPTYSESLHTYPMIPPPAYSEVVTQV